MDEGTCAWRSKQSKGGLGPGGPQELEFSISYLCYECWVLVRERQTDRQQIRGEDNQSRCEHACICMMIEGQGGVENTGGGPKV
jgi:hypothetical protein